MNGVHDMGGMHCFGQINPDQEEPLFHHDWEKKVLALTLAMGATGQWNLDESRSMRESLPADFYLSAGYYRIWLAALEQLLIKKQLVTSDELVEGKSTLAPKSVKTLSAERVPSLLAAGAPVDRQSASLPKFSLGQRVLVRNYQPTTHTRLPGYLRGRTGVIKTIHGCHVYPDSHARGDGESPEWLYNVCFDADELWCEQTRNSPSPDRPGFVAVRVDCWEPYLSCFESGENDEQ